MRPLALAVLAASLLLAAPAAAHPLDGELGPAPSCEVAGNTLACASVWYSADPEGWALCLVLADPITTCFDAWCTLDHPPSHCRFLFLDYGVRA